MTKHFDFYFDFASPFAFLASRKVTALAKTIGRDIHWRPFMIGAVFKEYGGAPTAHPLKSDYITKDFLRRSKLEGVPEARFPENFPNGAIPPSRVTYWIEDRAPEQVSTYVQAAFQAYWIDGHDTADVETALDVAVGLGFDRDTVAAGIQEKEIKDRLRLETEKAISRGVFGSPYILIDDEPFWGGDRFQDIEHLYGIGEHGNS